MKGSRAGPQRSCRLTFGSLFSGIGGLDLGLERAGLTCEWQVENNPYAAKILSARWPNTKKWSDVRTFPPRPFKRWKVTLIAGGFPCQPVSTAGRQKGDADPRWLWPEFARILRTLRPPLALLENVPGLRSCIEGRLFGEVLKDLAALGYDAQWDCLPAASFGAPHRRDRFFIVAYRHVFFCRSDLRVFEGCRDLADYFQLGCYAAWNGVRIDREAKATYRPFPGLPRIRRMDDGTANWVDRVRAIGNAVVPIVAQAIGARILDLARHARRGL